MIEDFYPTPASLIEKMFRHIDWREIETVLEPSAGKGDLCDAARRRLNVYSNRRVSIDVIEINPDLQALLRGKEYNLIQDDFLRFETSKCYDLIIANFPFSAGADHLAKALSMIRSNGGQLVCLVNAETIRNPHTLLRQKIVSLLEDLGASIEYLAEEFTEAERRTDVEVALINLTVEKTAGDSTLLDNLMRSLDPASEDAVTQDDLVERDFKRAMVARFNLEARTGVALIDEWFSLKPYLQNRLKKAGESNEYTSPLIELKVKDSNYRESRSAMINTYLTGLREKYWHVLIHDPRYIGQYTSNIVSDLQSKLRDLCNCDFNLFNIEQLAKDLNSRITKGVEKAILDLFDKLSHAHAYDKTIHNGNVHYYDGWKTNKAWKINHRVILPMYGLEPQWGGAFRIRYGKSDELNDIVKVFNYLSADKIETRQLVGQSIKHADDTQNFDLDLRYFRIKLFKKGTCHITFTDLDLLAKFNIYGSQRKGWLPPSYGKQTYDDLDPEDRVTVDTFQGKDAYNKVMANADYFIVEDSAGLLGSGGVDEESL